MLASRRTRVAARPRIAFTLAATLALATTTAPAIAQIAQVDSRHPSATSAAPRSTSPAIGSLPIRDDEVGPAPTRETATRAAATRAAANRDAAIAKWRALKYGMFIHWGLFSLAGGEWNGAPVKKGYSEQIQMWANISRDDYAALATRFSADRFDPDAIARLAREAGMRYIILTAKHHDGFSMFATKQSRYNVVEATPFAKDAVRLLAEAARREGLGFGVYFSLVDWHQGHAFDPNNNNPIPPEMERFIEGQLRELLGDYGPMVEVWFDMSSPTPAQSQRFADIVHTLQPEALVNGRIWNNRGDFIVLGDNQVPDFPIRDPWETPASIYHATWGYRAWQERTDLPGKIKELTRNLVHVAARGGVYLLNIGPRGDGSVVEFEADVLRGIGQWLRTNGEAVYDTTLSPLQGLPWGESTLRGQTMYLHVMEWPADGRLIVPGLLTTPTSVRALEDATSARQTAASKSQPNARQDARRTPPQPAAPLRWARAGNDLVIDVSAIKPDPAITVLRLDLPELPRVAPRVVFTPKADGTFELPFGVWERERSRAGGDYYAQKWTFVRLRADVRAPNGGPAARAGAGASAGTDTYTLTLRGLTAPPVGPLRLRVNGRAREVTIAPGATEANLGTIEIARAATDDAGGAATDDARADAAAAAAAGPRGATRIELGLAAPELPQQDIGLRFTEAILTPVRR